MDYDFNHITPCCYVKQLGERVREAEQKGFNLFLNSGDVTLGMVLPILVRFRLGAELTIAVTEGVPQVIMALVDAANHENVMAMAEYVPELNKRIYSVKKLNLILTPDMYEKSEKIIRELLEPYKERVNVSVYPVSESLIHFANPYGAKTDLHLTVKGGGLFSYKVQETVGEILSADSRTMGYILNRYLLKGLQPNFFSNEKTD